MPPKAAKRSKPAWAPKAEHPAAPRETKPHYKVRSERGDKLPPQPVDAPVPETKARPPKKANPKDKGKPKYKNKPGKWAEGAPEAARPPKPQKKKKAGRQP